MQNMIYETLYMTLIIVVGTMGMGYIIGLINRMYLINMAHVRGNKKITFASFIGVPMHEIGHYIMCKIFRHKVLEVNLLNFDESRNLGSVSHAYNKRNIWQSIGTYFIPQGPLWTGSLSVFLLMKLFVPDMLASYKIMQEIVLYDNSYTLTQKIVELVSHNLGQLVNNENIKSVWFWVFIFLSTSIAIYSDMSSVDIKNAIRGTKYVIIISFVVNLVGKFGGTMNYVMKYNMWVVSMLTLLLTMSVVALIISLITRVVVKGIRNIRN